MSTRADMSEAIEAADASIGREANALPNRLRMWAHPQNWPGPHSVESDVVRYDMRKAADELDRLATAGQERRVPEGDSTEHHIDEILQIAKQDMVAAFGEGAEQYRREAIKAILAAENWIGVCYERQRLSASPSTPSAPKDWKLAPLSPTNEMWEAGRAADTCLGGSYGKVWTAMLAKAPAPPALRSVAEAKG